MTHKRKLNSDQPLNNLITQAKEQIKLNEYDSAIDALLRISDYENTYHQAIVMLGFCYAKKEQYDIAIEYFSSVPKCHHQFQNSQLLLSKTLISNNEYHRAQFAINSILNIMTRQPNYGEKIQAIKSMKRIILCKSLLCTGQPGQTEKNYNYNERYTTSLAVEDNDTSEKKRLNEARNNFSSHRTTLDNMTRAYETASFMQGQSMTVKLDCLERAINYFEMVAKETRYYQLAQAEIAAIYLRDFDIEAAIEIRDCIVNDDPYSYRTQLIINLNQLIETVRTEINNDKKSQNVSQLLRMFDYKPLDTTPNEDSYKKACKI